MADGVIFVGWAAPRPGREEKADEVFGEVMQYWTGLQQQGRIESFDAVYLQPHGGDWGGFLLIKDDPMTLGQIQGSPEFIRLSMRAQLVVEGFGAIGGVTGGELVRQFEMYQKEARELLG
jgi:hypothetical protein